MALEEMPPHTAYGTMIREMVSGGTVVLMAARCTRDEAGEYLMMIVPDGDLSRQPYADTLLTMIVRFPDHETFVKRLAAAPYVRRPAIWLPDWSGWAKQMLAVADLRDEGRDDT